MHELKKYIVKPLVLIGALNWGLVGAFGFDLVAAIFGPGTIVTRVIYILVGISAAICIAMMLMPNKEMAQHRK